MRGSDAAAPPSALAPPRRSRRARRTPARLRLDHCPAHAGGGAVDHRLAVLFGLEGRLMALVTVIARPDQPRLDAELAERQALVCVELDLRLRAHDQVLAPGM